ncbi:MAG: hypothetical protein ACKO3G_14410 [Planctomycetaceae bacterium]
MRLLAGILGAASAGLKRMERHSLRPLLQAVRTPRHRRAARARATAESEELLVALLRERLRDRGASGAAPAAAEALPGPVDALVAGLLDVPPRGTATVRLATPGADPDAGAQAPLRRAA